MHKLFAGLRQGDCISWGDWYLVVTSSGADEEQIREIGGLLVWMPIEVAKEKGEIRNLQGALTIECISFDTGMIWLIYHPCEEEIELRDLPPSFPGLHLIDGNNPAIDDLIKLINKPQ